ncbi:MAG: FAD-dependent oxidoreductase [Pseudomonadota bacterium]
MAKDTISILGAGIVGLWQALMFAKAGYDVHLLEKDETLFASSASRYAGAMLAPFCEEESAEAIIRDLGLRSMELWFEQDPDIIQNGSLVLALPREQKELKRFARMTKEHVIVSKQDLDDLEPDLDNRFDAALFYPKEAHFNPQTASQKLLTELRNYGCKTYFGPDQIIIAPNTTWHIDCRGIAAQDILKTLRAVRGERVVVRCKEINFRRPLRLLHARFPIYIVPWPDQTYMIGATVIESSDTRAMTVRSALELLSAVYSVQPRFAEAEIMEFGAGLRPAFPDNIPKIIKDKNTLYVNGMYRHGFLLAPVLAEMTVNYVESGQMHPEIFIADYFER